MQLGAAASAALGAVVHPGQAAAPWNREVNVPEGSQC